MSLLLLRNSSESHAGSFSISMMTNFSFCFAPRRSHTSFWGGVFLLQLLHTLFSPHQVSQKEAGYLQDVLRCFLLVYIFYKLYTYRYKYTRKQMYIHLIKNLSSYPVWAHSEPAPGSIRQKAWDRSGQVVSPSYMRPGPSYGQFRETNRMFSDCKMKPDNLRRNCTGGICTLSIYAPTQWGNCTPDPWSVRQEWYPVKQSISL